MALIPSGSVQRVWYDVQYVQNTVLCATAVLQSLTITAHGLEIA